MTHNDEVESPRQVGQLLPLIYTWSRFNRLAGGMGRRTRLCGESEHLKNNKIPDVWSANRK